MPPPVSQVTETNNWKPDSAHADELSSEDAAGNGIEVGAPKIYDDASLRLMLDATRAALATMTGLNQGALTSSLGSLNGATISQTQFGLQVSGPSSLPSVATTFTGPTTSTTTNANLPTGNTSVPGSSTIATTPTESSTITNTPTPATMPVVPAGIAFTPPGSVSPSSLDMLNEQMQLTSAITSYELLLEGALSDRLVTNIRTVKPRVTLGFPISLTTPAAYRDAVAIVEVEVRLPEAALSNERPAVTQLLPQEKTYNVAAMTDHMTSIGAGVVVGTVGVGASGAWGHKSLYLVQDQDTVAMPRPAGTDPKTTSFLWEFRPVLGQRYVRGGMKQTFVQLALPELWGVDCYGSVRIHTYWRRFDRDTGLVGPVIAKSVLTSRQSFSLARYDLAPEVARIDYQDLGDGTLAVHVFGKYLSGTYVQIGAQRYEAGKNLIMEDLGAKFVVPASALAQWTGQVVARSGASTPLLQLAAQPNVPALNQNVCANPKAQPIDLPHVDLPPGECPAARILDAEVKVLSESDSQLRVTVDYSPLNPRQRRLLLAVGNKVFGLRDAPLWRDYGAHADRLTVDVPTALLMANPEVHVFQPFLTDVGSRDARCLSAWARLGGFFNPDSTAEHLVLVSQDKDGNASYLLYGNHLGHARVLVPDTGVTLSVLDHVSLERIQLLHVTKAALATTKKVVLQKADAELPLALDLPAVKPMPIKVSADSPVVQGVQTLDVSVERAKDVAGVKFKDRTVRYTSVVKPDGSVSDSDIRLTNLKDDGVTDQQRSANLTIKYRNGDTASLTLDVVAARVSVKSADKPAAADSTPSTQ